MRTAAVYSRLTLILFSLPCTLAWSFRNFFEGDWDLERLKGGELTRAHYSMQPTSDGMLEGSFWEEGSAEKRINEMRVRVEFDLAAPDTVGSFQVAKPKVYDDEPPTPLPAGKIEFGNFSTLFKFDFQPRNTEDFWISESK